MTTWHIARMAATILLAVSATQGATIFVDVANCPGPGSGTVRDPYCSIQTAIGVVINGDDIIVAPGTYRELIDFLGKSITLRSSDGPEVTIINGDIDDDGTGDGTVVFCITNETALTVLDGFTITGGQGDFGGGMRNGPGSPTVTNCIFRLNNPLEQGGGMFNGAGGNPTVIGCIFSNNSALFGGGMRNAAGSPTVINCTFSDNHAAIDGGGMHNNSNSTATVTNCIFSRNTAVGVGGGLVNADSGNPTVTNCTFSQNAGNGTGGAISAMLGTFANCIVFGNTSTGGVNEISGTPTVTYSDVLGGFAGIGNININPLFIDFENQDYHISPGSPCIDAAENAAVPPDEFDLDGDFDFTELIPFDHDGNPRFFDDVDTPDCPQKAGGCGDPPVVDMGAFEFQTVPPCPWDCGGGDDGDVGIVDFLSLLAQWDTPGTCDFDGGGVGINDFLELLANWGPCP